jgi:hypothetical protein
LAPGLATWHLIPVNEGVTWYSVNGNVNGGKA